MKRRTFITLSLAAAPLTLHRLCPQQISEDCTQHAVRTKPGEERFGEPYRVSVGHMECKVSAKDTHGAMAAFEALTHQPDCPVKHLPHEQDEWFYIGEGKYEMHVGDERFRLRPSGSLFASRKVPHVWCCVSEQPGRIIALLQPAGTIEEFYRELPKYIANGASPEEFRSSTAPMAWRSSGRGCQRISMKPKQPLKGLCLADCLAGVLVATPGHAADTAKDEEGTRPLFEGDGTKGFPSFKNAALKIVDTRIRSIRRDVDANGLRPRRKGSRAAEGIDELDCKKRARPVGHPGLNDPQMSDAGRGCVADNLSSCSFASARPGEVTCQYEAVRDDSAHPST